MKRNKEEILKRVKERVIRKIKVKCARDGAVYIEGSYVRSNILFKFKCRCGKIKETTWASLWKERCKAFCRECSIKEFSNKQRNRVKEDTFHRIFNFCRKYDLIPILETYRGWNRLMSFKCSCGEIFEKSWKDMISKNSYVYCQKCKLKYGEAKSKNREEAVHRNRIIKEINKICEEWNSKPDFEFYKNGNIKNKFICKCGKIFYQSFISLKGGKPPLCEECHKKTISGINNFHWNSKLTDEERLRFRWMPEYLSWSIKVKRYYNFTCQVTGQKMGKGLISHHLYSWNNNIDKRFELSNGICIKKDIHKKFHDMYGYGNNTPKQFEEFCDEEFEKNMVNFRIFRGIW